MKLCINCKYFKAYNVLQECNHPNNKIINLVDGHIILRYSPNVLRHRNTKHKNFCGKDGKWFEEKEIK